MPERDLARLGLALPPPPEPIGNYVPWRLGGNMLFLSGVGPRNASGFSIVGKVGQALTIEQGYEAAKLCGLNLIANMQVALGSIDRVELTTDDKLDEALLDYLVRRSKSF